MKILKDKDYEDFVPSISILETWFPEFRSECTSTNDVKAMII